MYYSLTITCWLCARPLPSGLTGPGAASSQIVSCVTAKADPVIVVPSTAQTLAISWYWKQTACDNYRKRYINQIQCHYTFISTEGNKGILLQMRWYVYITITLLLERCPLSRVVSILHVTTIAIE